MENIIKTNRTRQNVEEKQLNRFFELQPITLWMCEEKDADIVYNDNANEKSFFSVKRHNNASNCIMNANGETFFAEVFMGKRIIQSIA